MSSTAPLSEHPAAAPAGASAAEVDIDYEAREREDRRWRAERVGRFIAERRAARGLSQAEFARQWGVDRSRVNQIEMGRGALVNSATLATLADALGLSLSERVALFETAGRALI